MYNDNHMHADGELPIVEQSPHALQPAITRTFSESERKVARLTKTVRRLGTVSPILVDDSGWVIAGHDLVQAAVALGMEEVPTISIENFSPEELRLYLQGTRQGVAALRAGIAYKPERDASGRFISRAVPKPRPNMIIKKTRIIREEDHANMFALARYTEFERWHGKGEPVSHLQMLLSKMAENAAEGWQCSIDAFMRHMDMAIGGDARPINFVENAFGWIDDLRDEAIRMTRPRGADLTTFFSRQINRPEVPSSWRRFIRPLDELDTVESMMTRRAAA